MKRLAEYSTRRPLVVILAWIAALVTLYAANTVAGPDFRDSFSLKNTDSQAAYDILAEQFPELAGSSDTIVWGVDSGSVNDPAVQARMDSVLVELASVPAVVAVVSPHSAEGAGQTSADSTVAFARLYWEGEAFTVPLESVRDVGAIASTANGGDDITVAYGGQGARRLSNPEVGIGEIIGIAIAAVILFAAFGSLLATTVPLLSAVAALGAALGVLGLASNAGPISSSAPTLAILLGLGLGIDYALFITNRHRRGLKEGRGVSESIVGAATTSGRAVVFAGVTVFIALTGMYVPRIGILTGLATSAAVTVLFSVATSLTLVPALLRVYGMRVLSRRERALLAPGHISGEDRSGRGTVAAFVERHPIVTSVVALGAILSIAYPVAGLRLGNSDQGNDPVGATTRTAYDLIEQGFGPGANGPLLVVATLDGPGAPAALADLGSALALDPTVSAMVGPIPSASGTAALFQVVPATSPQDLETVDLVSRIRTEYGPDGAEDGVTVHVGGAVASNVDFAASVTRSLPLFFSIVILLSMLVLAIAFRSLVLPAIGAALNLLAAAAAFGVIVAVFQWGWGHSLFGIGEGGPVEPFVPLILFALLFGLSMDYQVFLVSRVAELWRETGDNALAVRRGLSEVSRVIIAAAAIMVVVFGSFATSDSRIIKLMAIGLSSAIFLDAFVIRVTLMPAVMRLLGRANWWMPRWLDRILPHVTLDAGDVRTPREERELSSVGA